MRVFGWSLVDRLGSNPPGLFAVIGAELMGVQRFLLRTKCLQQQRMSDYTARDIALYHALNEELSVISHSCPIKNGPWMDRKRFLKKIQAGVAEQNGRCIFLSPWEVVDSNPERGTVVSHLYILAPDFFPEDGEEWAVRRDGADHIVLQCADR